MIRFLFIILLFLFQLTSYSQFKEIFSNYKKGNLKQSLYLLDSLSNHSENEKIAEFWYLKGMVYESIYITKDSALTQQLGQPPLIEAFEAFEKALSLSSDKNLYHETRKHFEKDFANILLKEGIKQSKEKKVDDAVLLLECYTKLEKKDTSGYMLLATNAEKALNYEIAKTSYLKLLELGHKTPFIYKSLFHIYFYEEKNMEESAKLISKARKLYPKDLDFDKMEIELLLHSKKISLGLKKLDSIRLNDAANELTYLFNIGTIYASMDSIDYAITYFNKCLKIDSLYYNALYNLGGIYYKKAHNLYEKINAMNYHTYIKKGKSIEKEGHAFALEALPYFEKCYSIKKEGDVQMMLIDTYINLKQRHKAHQLQKNKNL